MLLLFPLGILLIFALYKGAVYFDYVLIGILGWLFCSAFLGLHNAYSSVGAIGLIVGWHFVNGREIFGVKVFRALGAVASAGLMTWLVPYLFLADVALDPEWIIVIRVAVFLVIMFVRFSKGEIRNRAV